MMDARFCFLRSGDFSAFMIHFPSAKAAKGFRNLVSFRSTSATAKHFAIEGGCVARNVMRVIAVFDVEARSYQISSTRERRCAPSEKPDVA